MIREALGVMLISTAMLSGKVFATPPFDITLSYDQDQHLLHVQAKHPSDRVDRYYLRRIMVLVNEEEARTLYLSRQKLPWGISEDIDLEAKPGDKIGVEITASEGGMGKAEISLPKAEDKDQEELLNH